MSSLLLTFSLACLLITGSVYADCPPVITNGKLHGVLPVVAQKVTYSDVVDCGSVAQADLFRRARLWIAQSSHSATDTFTLLDKETGDLVARMTQVVTLPRSESSAGGSYTFQYRFVIECANRKYRATLTQVELVDGGTMKASPIETYCQKSDKDVQTLYAELDKHLTQTLASLQEAVKNYKSF
jgi:hypothetical protein